MNRRYIYDGIRYFIKVLPCKVVNCAEYNNTVTSKNLTGNKNILYCTNCGFRLDVEHLKKEVI